MKVKFSTIPFIPAVIVMVLFRIMSIFGADENGNFLGMNKMETAYTVIGIGVALFVVCVLINIFDRRTAPVYPLKKNPAAGVFAILSGVAVIASSAATFLTTTTDSEYYTMTLICAIFAIPAGIAFMVMSKTHFSGESMLSSASILFVFPALWGCTELVYEFLSATRVSIAASDLTSLFCYIFVTLYYFSHSMVVSRIKGRNPIKSCFIYGVPAVALLISHSIYTFITAAQENAGYAVMLSAAQLLILALYAGSFIVEMTFNSYTKDEIEIIDGLPDEEEQEEQEKKYIHSDSYNDLVFSDRDNSDVRRKDKDYVEEYYASNKYSIDDFIIGYTAPVDDEPVPYLTKEEMDKSKKNSFVIGAEPKADENESKAVAGADLISSKDSDEAEAEAKAKAEAEAKAKAEAVEKARLEAKARAEAAAKAKAEAEEKAKAAEKELSDIDKLLQELDSKK